MKHKHHIIPKYRCIELGIDPEFEDNYAYPTRHQHALIHWGYKCNDLSPLLEVCNPPQYVIDMIPLGDNRDVGAASMIAKGEIDEIDVFGENNPNWKGGISSPQSPERKEYMKNYGEKNKDKKREYDSKRREYFRQYEQTPERKEYMKKYRLRNKLELREYMRKYRLRKKLEKQQGQGTLEPFIG